MKNLMKKESLLTFILFAFASIAFAQDKDQNIQFVQNTQQLVNAANTNNNPAQGSAMRFVNPPRAVDGSNYLWNSWDNKGIIVTEDEQKFLIKNVNLNVRRNVFESKINQDSIFSFNFNNVDRFIINNKVYKNFYWEDDNRVYQLLFENDDFQFLKGFKINYVEGSANPMLGRKNDRIVKKEYYFVRQEGQIKVFRPSKKKFMKLVEADEIKEANIKEWVKTNDLSFKKEADISKILEYATQL